MGRLNLVDYVDSDRKFLTSKVNRDSINPLIIMAVLVDKYCSDNKRKKLKSDVCWNL